jgi:two-component system phosphate regulon sensor histidine kinase PhoR
MILSGRPWRLFLTGGLFVVATCGVSLWLLEREEARTRNPQLAGQLLVQAQMVRDVLRAQWPVLPQDAVPVLLQTLHAAGVHVTVVDVDGNVLLGAPDGTRDPGLLLQPEARQALRTGSAAAVRAWGPVNRLHLIAAARIGPDEHPHGLVWLTRPAWTATRDPGALPRLLATVGMVAAVATLVFVVLVLQVRRRLFQRVIATARAMSFQERATLPQFADDDEFGDLVATLHDLRTRVASQVELIDRQRGMLQTLVEQLHEGVIVARADGRVVLVNPAAVRMLDLRPDDPHAFVGRPVEACFPQHALQVLLTAPGATNDSESSEPVRLTVSGREGTTYLLARASELLLPDPEQGVAATMSGRVVVLSDVTELQRALQVRTDFVANASHELRTPLSLIRAAVETLLAMDLTSEAELARQFLGKIDRHSQRLEQMVQDLLDLSRLESPTERFAPEDIDLRRWLEELHGRFVDALERKSQHWETRIEPPHFVTLRANPHLLRLVLDNLVDNAIRFTDPGGHIGVYVRHNGEHVIIEVHDDGCGIPAEDQQRVFERFYQVQRSRSGPERGTGLGLSIVRHAVGALGGSVRLESQVGVGTRVIVTLPYTPASAAR